ncbi:universal stress protein [Winogradskyella sp. 3972H.M.0a.05]|uniref:universal stress protein n=1 Tax=Winogradskyella sp. 3972H.M.0a.05 TaxID=2950277 RepID=UPI00339B4254
MRNILVPIGASENGKSTLQYAIDFASTIEANVFVLKAFNVVNKAGHIGNVEEVIERTNTQSLKEVIEQVDTKDVDVKVIAAKGIVVDAIQSVNDELGIDLVVVGPRPNDHREELFLGRTSGSIIKQTEIPVLVVPEGYAFKSIERILTAIKSGVIKNKESIKPLEEIIDKFKAKMHLLQVKTTGFLQEDLEFFSDLAAITSSYNSSENATLFQGVLEHLNERNPDLICVFRRKRGFFKKLWEQNTIKKVEFESRLPLLVLKGAE